MITVFLKINYMKGAAADFFWLVIAEYGLILFTYMRQEKSGGASK